MASEFVKNPKFENLLDLEFEAQGAMASVAFRPAGTPLYRMQQVHDSAARAKKALSDAVDALTVAEMMEYGAYRAASHAFYADKHASA